MGGVDFVPYRIKTHRRSHIRNNERIRPCHRFGFRIVHVVLVSVLQGINAIFTWRYTTDGELPPAICTRNAVERELGESRIVQILMQSHLNALYRFQILGIEHGTRYSHGIYLGTSRKGIRKLT